MASLPAGQPALRRVNKPGRRLSQRTLLPESIFAARQLEACLTELGLPVKQRERIWHHMIGRDQPDLIQAKNVSPRALSLFPARFTKLTSRVVDERPSPHGTKLVIRLQDGHLIETVVIHHTQQAKPVETAEPSETWDERAEPTQPSETRDEGGETAQPSETRNAESGHKQVVRTQQKNQSARDEPLGSCVCQQSDSESSLQKPDGTCKNCNCHIRKNQKNDRNCCENDSSNQHKSIGNNPSSSSNFNTSNTDTNSIGGGITSSREKTKLTNYSTVCVSSQVGCKMACSFCETGTMGLLANLTAAEICEQVYHARQRCAIRNVVFMGMGEPLDNYSALVEALSSLNHRLGLNIPYSHITVSTVGIAPYIARFGLDCPKVNLALSLHAPTSELRAGLVPSTKAFSVQTILESLDIYIQRCNDPKKTVLIEYIMIQGINSTLECAHLLGRLLAGKPVFVNLIPYNPTKAGARFDYKSPSDDEIQFFQAVLGEYPGHTGRHLSCHVRWSSRRGQETDAACGQLALTNLKRLAGLEHESISSSEFCGEEQKDIEDLATLGYVSDVNTTMSQSVRARKRKGLESQNLGTRLLVEKFDAMQVENKCRHWFIWTLSSATGGVLSRWGSLMFLLVACVVLWWSFHEV
eukprot:gb/GEZN01003677.1/.p1 GENE.gb/GEZN01003677.1/~~gb/GEZN01003677.1/.p1  ORF type:complete len:648 (-),score=83.09 gb/GEZN01003677.1/:174-2090(-)